MRQVSSNRNLKDGDKGEGATWRVVASITGATKALPASRPNPTGWMTVPRFRRVCASVARRAAVRLEAVALQTGGHV